MSRQRAKKWISGGLAVFLTVIAITNIALSVGETDDAMSFDFSTFEKTSEPNQYLVCPPGLCSAAVDRGSPIFDIDADALLARWQTMISQQRRTRELTGNPDMRQYSFVQRSLIFGFPDVITMRIFARPENRSTLAIYSRSRYGFSDFGVNKRRIESWLAGLD